jgi:ribosomal protein S1
VVTGIISGKVKGELYCRYHTISLPAWFSGRRSPCAQTVHLEGKELNSKLSSWTKRNNVVVSRRARFMETITVLNGTGISAEGMSVGVS